MGLGISSPKCFWKARVSITAYTLSVLEQKPKTNPAGFNNCRHRTASGGNNNDPKLSLSSSRGRLTSKTKEGKEKELGIEVVVGGVLCPDYLVLMNHCALHTKHILVPKSLFACLRRRGLGTRILSRAKAAPTKESEKGCEEGMHKPKRDHVLSQCY